ncbi:MAG: hypothetical protein H0V60_12890, partial [Actinobacteria bacterium]|nr:hypothetical protein [Actinomycetota bacterium]
MQLSSAVRSRPVRIAAGTCLAFYSSLALMALPAAAATDSDRDGMPNRWETSNNLNPNHPNAKADPDKDRLKNLAEFRNDSEPKDEDTDNDGLDDGDEVKMDVFDDLDVDDNDSDGDNVE